MPTGPTLLTKQVSKAMNVGKIVTLALADGTNGNNVAADSEYMHLVVINTDSATHTITITRPKASNLGIVTAVGPITIPAAVTGKPGVWVSSTLPTDWFKSATTKIDFTFDATPTGVYVAVVDMTPSPSAVE
jgi:hypothetical protein